MILQYRGTWGNVVPYIGDEPAPTNPFVARVEFPDGSSDKCIVYPTPIIKSVQDHGHEYPAVATHLRIRTLYRGLWTMIKIPEGTDLAIFHYPPSRLFYRGQHVLYVPTHAGNNLHHVDVENGVVFSVNDSVVFVKYGTDDPNRGITAKATSPHDLFRV